MHVPWHFEEEVGNQMADSTSSEQRQYECLQEIAPPRGGLNCGAGTASPHGSAGVRAWQNSELWCIHGRSLLSANRS